MLLLLIALVVGLIALGFVRQREAQRVFALQLRPKPGNRVDILKWLAILPLIPAAPLLFFGLTWLVPGLLGAGLAFVGAALLIWRVFAREWPVARLR